MSKFPYSFQSSDTFIIGYKHGKSILNICCHAFFAPWIGDNIKTSYETQEEAMGDLKLLHERTKSLPEDVEHDETSDENSIKDLAEKVIPHAPTVVMTEEALTPFRKKSATKKKNNRKGKVKRNSQMS